MSTLWTPSGERPIRREPEPPPAPPAAEPAAGPPGTPPSGYGEDLPPEMVEQIAAMQAQMLRTPAVVVIVNQALAFYELAALHLDEEHPDFEAAQLAIDAFAAVVEGLGPRLGPNERPLREALAQIRLGFVQVKGATGPRRG